MELDRIKHDAWKHLVVGFSDNPEIFDGLHDGARNTAKCVWEYDETIAEIRREKEARMRKYLRKHEVRNDGHTVKKEKRKDYDKRKHYNCDFYRGLMTVRKYRELEAEKADALDYALEQESIAEYAMWEKINFDVETERLKALEVWLEWA